MKTLRFVFLTLLGFFGLLYLLYVSYVYFNQSEMVFVANKLPDNFKFKFQQDYTEYQIPSFDGAKQDGLLFKTAHPKGLIFYLHGNAGSLDSWGTIAQIYTDLGYDFFILDYRGFGKSEGEIVDQQQVFKDVSIVYDKMSTLYDSKKIIIVGYSIGTGPASYLASIKNPQKLILLAPFYNFLEFTSGSVPYVPDFLKKFQFETNKYLVTIKSPIYIFHGNKDQVISYENSVRLSKLLKPKDAFYTLENQNHLGINENTDFQILLKSILEK